MKFVKKISEYGNSGPNEATWKVIIKIKNGLVDLYFTRPTPFCKDGYKHEMDKLLIQKGWEASGMMGMTYKEEMPPSEFASAFSFIEAYAKVYEDQVKDPYADIPLTLQDFLNLVEEEKRNSAAAPSSIEGIIGMLAAEGFELIEDN